MSSSICWGDFVQLEFVTKLERKAKPKQRHHEHHALRSARSHGDSGM